MQQKIENFIELLNQGYIPKNVDKETKFSNGEPISWFWGDNKERIKEQLFSNKKYQEGYEKAKKVINNLEFDKISDFIELLNQGYIPKKVDKQQTFSNGQLINQFWSTRDNKYKIQDRLFTDEKYKVGYETAKQIVADKLGIAIDVLDSGDKKL